LSKGFSHKKVIGHLIVVYFYFNIHVCMLRYTCIGFLPLGCTIWHCDIVVFSCLSKHWKTVIANNLYQSMYNTRVCTIPEYAQYQSMHNTRVCTIPEYVQYQSMHNTRVCTIPEYAEYQSMQNTRVCRIPEYAQYQSVIDIREHH